MAKIKIAKIASIEEEIKQLKERQKSLKQQHNAQERKDRTKRLCKRMGLFESILPDTIPLTEEQFKVFLEKTVTTEHSRRILDGLTAQNAAPADKPAYTGQESGEDKRKTRATAQGYRCNPLPLFRTRAHLYTTRGIACGLLLSSLTGIFQ